MLALLGLSWASTTTPNARKKSLLDLSISHERKKSLLAEHEEVALAGFLKNLHGSLSKFNDRLVRPQRLPPLPALPGSDSAIPRFLVDLSAITGSSSSSDHQKKVLCVGENNYAPIHDRDLVTKSEKLVQELDKTTTEQSGNNRSSAKVSMQGLSNQIRYAVKKHGGGMRKAFKVIDCDSSGTIDKTELKVGLHKLGVCVSGADVDIVWPLFDSDNNGSIDYEEFFEFMLAGGVGRYKRRLFRDKPPLSLRHDRMIVMERTLQQTTINERRKRISQKTQVGHLLKKAKRHIERAWAGRDAAREADDLYRRIDVTGDGTVDKTEFYAALHLLNFDRYKGEELQLLWSIIDTDGSGAIDQHEFVGFFKGKATNLTHISDRMRDARVVAAATCAGCAGCSCSSMYSSHAPCAMRHAPCGGL